jgi:agmatinase
MDQGFVSGTSVPEPGGLTPREVLRLVRAFASKGVEGYVIVECSPARDPANNAARLAARLAFDVLAVTALRKRPSA